MDRGTDQETPPTLHGNYARRVIVAVGVATLAVVLLLLLWYAVQALLLTFAGILLAILLRSVADVIGRFTGLSSGWALLVVALALVGAFGLVVWFVAPNVIDQASEFADRLPGAAASLKDRLNQYGWGRQIVRQVSRFSRSGAQPQAVARAAGLLYTAGSAALSVFVVLFLGIYLAAKPRLYVAGMLRLAPKARRARLLEVLQSIGHVLRWWMIGQATDMAIIGTLTAVGLWVIGVPLAMLLGLIAALFNFIPNFGPLFSYVPAVLLALVESPAKAAWVTVLFLILQNLEGYVILPMVQRRAIDLPPGLLIFIQVLLAVVAGPLGFALATPLAAASMVAVKMLYVEDALGDRGGGPPAGNEKA